MIQLKGDTVKKPLFLTYPSSGSALVTISEGTTILNFETGTITDVDGEVTNMKQSLQNRGFEWARSFFIQSDKLISVQIDDNDPIISSEERDAYGIHQQFKRIKLTAYENTDVFVIVSTSPDALIQMVSNIFVMKGLGASGYPVAVDVNGYLTTIIYGDQGAIAQDANNKLISVMQGSQGIDVAQELTTGELIAAMKGDDSGTLRTIAVDANARLEAVMKGLYGATFKTLATDTNGNLIAILKGASGNDIAVDASGYLTAIMHGDQGAVAQDANNKLISVMQGSQGIDVAQELTTGELIAAMKGDDSGTLRTIAVDSNARIEAVMKGLASGTPTTINLDADGNIIAVMKGEYDSALQTVALDSEHRMIARTLSGIEAIVRKTHVGNATSENFSIMGDLVPAGKLWKITNAVVYNHTGFTDYIQFGVHPKMAKGCRDVPAKCILDWDGELWLDAGERMFAAFIGVTIDDPCNLIYRGTQISEL